MAEADGERANIGFVGTIVAVATVGGFMFTYDSGVINGTQKGWEAAFALSRLGIGVNVAAVSFFFVRAPVNETRGRELEDMTG